ncbi:hypothetical protein N9954_09040 [Maribacter sp.]|nr:hypothetical protein [Maribacter sp.]
MEKITYAPLVEDLKTHSALYNQLYGEYHIRYGHFPSAHLSKWMVEVVQPMIRSINLQATSKETLHSIIRSAYTHSLKLIANGLAITYEDDYRRAWSVLEKLTKLMVDDAEKTLSALHEALNKLRKYTPDKVLQWCDLIETSSAEVTSLADFKTAARIYAWHCGLAHLRPKLQSGYERLPGSLKKSILASLRWDSGTENPFKHPWKLGKPQFEGIAGGFQADKGYFSTPPKLAVIQQTVFVADKQQTYAFFADTYGKTLLPVTSVEPKAILDTDSAISDFKKILRQLDTPFDHRAISSLAKIQDTIVYTLHNSYFLYTYSLPN